MNPRKPWKLIKQTADEIGVPESLVSDLIHLYWKQVRNALTSLESVRVRVENLGTFHIRANKLKTYIAGLDKKLEDIDQGSFNGYKQYDDLSKKLTLMRRALSEYEEEWSERKEHYENRRKNKGSFEE